MGLLYDPYGGSQSSRGEGGPADPTKTTGKTSPGRGSATAYNYNQPASQATNGPIDPTDGALAGGGSTPQYRSTPGMAPNVGMAPRATAARAQPSQMDILRALIQQQVAMQQNLGLPMGVGNGPA